MAGRRVSPRAWVLAAAVALTGCTSTGADDGPTSTASPSTVTSAPAMPSPTSAAELGARLHTGLDTVTSARVTFTGSYTGDATITLADGRLTALDSSGPTTSEQGFFERIRIADGKVYVRPEDIGRAPTGPWLQVTPSSSDPLAQRAAVSSAAIYPFVELGPLVDVLGAATSFEDTGQGMYSLGSFAPTARLTSLFGDDVVPTRVGVSLGPGDRLRSFQAQLTVGGVYRAVSATWFAFDEPVTITPPAPSEVATG